MSEIFIVMSEKYMGEDTSGRDIAEFAYDPEYDPGFFTTREDAEAWVAVRNDEAQAEYDRKKAEHDAKMPAYEAAQKAYSAVWEKYKAAMVKAGGHPGSRNPPAKPWLPAKQSFFTNYKIVPLAREGD